MAELERAKRRIKNAIELQSVVKIMKAISSANIQEYEESVRSLSEYNKTIELGLQIILQNNKKFLASNLEDKKGSLGAVVFGSEQGLCGKFNEIVARYALDRMAEMEHEERRVLAVGGRVFARLEDAGQSVEAHFSFSGDFLGITEVMGKVLAKIDMWRLESNINQIVLFYNRPISGISGVFSPQMAHLFPIDVKWLAGLAESGWQSHSLPTYSMNPDLLFSSLVREHLFFSLYRAFAESLASENSSRLSSMQAAERNIEEHLTELLANFRKQRQEAISSELLDILTGYEALSSR
ncbi:MAG: F0F1 ATP synthase subunit gamma [Methanotrichaceae archaeon]|nr:F0F1 ATP synthase subunit gamma [Methanotrichaceae archaeon]